MAKIIDYEPLDDTSGGPFAANFKDESGKSYLMFGPEAEQAAQRLDLQKKVQPDLRTAQNDVMSSADENQSRADVPAETPGMSRADEGANMSTPEGRAVQAPAPQVPPPSPEPTPQGESAPAQGGAAEPGAQAHIIGRDDKSGHTLYKMPDGSVWENVPGSAGSPGGLKLKTQTEKGGITEDVAHTQGVQQNYSDAQRILEMNYQSGVKQASYEAGYNQTLLKAQQAQAIEAAQKQKAAQSDADAYMVRRQQAVNDLNSAKVTPMKPDFLTTLGLAFGAFGAAMAKTPNFAMQLWDSKVQQNLQTQEAQIKVLGDKADNSLVDLKMKLGSLDAAKSAYSSAANSQGATQLRILASKTSNEQMKTQYLDLANKLEAKNLGETEADRIRRLGEVTKNYQNMPKTSGTAGGLRPATLGQSQSAATLDKTIAGTEATKAKGTAPGQIPRTLMPTFSAADSTKALGQGILDAYGVKRGDKPGWLEGQGMDVKRTFHPDKQRDIDSKIGNFFDEQYKMVTGNGPTESIKKEFHDQIKGWSTAQKLNFVNSSMDLADHKQKLIESLKTNAPEIGLPEAPTE